MNSIFNTKYKFYIKAVIILIVIAAVSSLYYRYYTCNNFKVVVADKIYRSGQPEMSQLAEWIDKYKLKTVVDLRGPTAPQAEDEAKVCDGKNINILYVKLNAYKKIPSDRLVELLDVIDSIEMPVLLHCNHGVDRSGTASALASWLLGFDTYTEAKKQSFVMPGPWKNRNGTGQHISNIFADYEEYCDKTSHNIDDRIYFEEWARRIYHPDYFYVGYKAKEVIYTEPGGMSEFQVKVTNLSDETIPAGDTDRRFRLFTRIKESNEILEPREKYSTCTLLKSEDLEPGESVNVCHTIQVPDEPGNYEFYIDMLEKEDHSFARQGSPEFEGTLVVLPDKEIYQRYRLSNLENGVSKNVVVQKAQMP